MHTALMCQSQSAPKSATFVPREVKKLGLEDSVVIEVEIVIAYGYR